MDLEARDKDQARPIHLACRFSTFEIIKYLVDCGVDLEAEDNEKCRPIHIASKYSTILSIAYLINKGANAKEYSLDGFESTYLIFRA